MKSDIDRRDFIKGSLVVGAGLSVFGTVAPARAAGTEEKIILGMIGTGGRGTQLTNGYLGMPQAEIRYVCDVDSKNVENAAKAVALKQKAKVTTVGDLRKVLDDPAVYAVVIATPDHWHAPAAIMAVAAGKHVYVEKPCCHNPAEGEMMIAAARKNNRVMQMGSQRRSYPKVREAIEKLKAGEIGTVLFSKGWYTAKREGIGHGKETPPPAWLDYAMWQGPAPERPYKDNILHYSWHWFWHWGTGELGNNGIHSLDICRWGLGVEYPRRVTAGGGRYYFNDDQETPDTHVVTYDFGDKLITWEGRSCLPNGVEGMTFGIGFFGSKGTLIIDNNGYRILDLKGKEMKKESDKASDIPHYTNFFECIRSGNRPNADIEEGYKSTLLCHLGNIAWRAGGTINCDQKNGHITGNAEAEKLWRREYRPGWEPKI